MDQSESDKNKGIGPLLYALGLVCFTTGARPVLSFMSGESSSKGLVVGGAACLVGIGMILTGYFWKPNPQSLWANRLGELGLNPTTYLVILFLGWVYMETLAIQRNNEIIALRNDEQAIAAVLDRFVLPRQLSDFQIKEISEYLQPFPTQEVTYEVAENDEEASSYWADIHKALEKAGWHMKTNGINYVKDPREGLSIYFVSTAEYAKNHSDAVHLNAGLVLCEVFGRTGVRVEGCSSGEANITENVLKITIGHRRRDSYAIPVPGER